MQGRPGARPTRSLLSSIERSLESLETMRAKVQARFEAELATSKRTEIDQLAEANLATTWRGNGTCSIRSWTSSGRPSW